MHPDDSLPHRIGQMNKLSRYIQYLSTRRKFSWPEADKNLPEYVAGILEAGFTG